MQKLRAYLQLVRLPAVFTALADIVLGFLLNHVTMEEAPGQIGLLLLASSGLYLSGMAFNDIFDRGQDALERPGRPIPSGRVSIKSATLLAIVLMLAGIGIAGLVARQSLYLALGLAACILCYDAVLKKTPWGPFAMGGCRFLNVMLGASAFDVSFSVWATPQTFIAAGLGIYIIGVTWFARHEANISSRFQLSVGAIIVNVGLFVLCLFVARPLLPTQAFIALSRFAGTGIGMANPQIVLLLLAVIMFTINRRLVKALKNPLPVNVQVAVKTMLWSLVMLDASLVYFKTGEPIYALATAALLIPAMTLGRWIFIT